MKRSRLAQGLSLVVLSFAFVLSAQRVAHADDPSGLVPASARGPGTTFATWGGSSGGPMADMTSVSRSSPITRARDMLTRSRFLDEAAAVDEKAATELAARLPSMRAAAKAARITADKASADDRELLGARAEDLETDVIVSEAEVTFKRKTAADNRHVARDLRVRAVKLVRDAPASDEASAQACDPPFHFTQDGRKVYRLECLR